MIVTPDTGDGTSHDGSNSVQVVLAVSGQAGPPSGCTFNGRTCQTSQAGDHSQPGGSPSQEQPQQESDSSQGSFSGR